MDPLIESHFRQCQVKEFIYVQFRIFLLAVNIAYVLIRTCTWFDFKHSCIHVELPTDAVSVTKTESDGGNGSYTEGVREDAGQKDGV